jgi:phenylalanyl-tRNA synthetase alpha chain
MHDTFFLRPDAETAERKVLRTHTSPVQVRTMVARSRRSGSSPGPDLPEGLGRHPHPDVPPGRGAGDRPDIHMGHLKWTLETFVARFFEVEGVRRRFRPHHFPFTEPSAEMDIGCDRSGRRAEASARARLAGDPRLRDGASQGAAELRHRSGRSTRASPSAWASSASPC